MSLIETLPTYEPKINSDASEIVNLNIRDLQNKYPNGCICCGTLFIPQKYSSMISQHFKTKKHEKMCIKPKNEIFKNEFGNSQNIIEAFDNKCKEIRELKKLNHEYKSELDIIIKKHDLLETLNLKLQNKLLNYNNNNNNVQVENLIDL